MLVLQQFAGMIPPDRMGVLFDYLVDASADPAFEKLISSMNRVSQQPAQAQPQQQQQLPQGQ
jgi:hypothetical protein